MSSLLGFDTNLTEICRVSIGTTGQSSGYLTEFSEENPGMARECEEKSTVLKWSKQESGGGDTYSQVGDGGEEDRPGP